VVTVGAFGMKSSATVAIGAIGGKVTSGGSVSQNTTVSRSVVTALAGGVGADASVGIGTMGR